MKWSSIDWISAFNRNSIELKWKMKEFEAAVVEGGGGGAIMAAITPKNFRWKSIETERLRNAIE